MHAAQGRKSAQLRSTSETSCSSHSFLGWLSTLFFWKEEYSDHFWLFAAKNADCVLRQRSRSRENRERERQTERERRERERERERERRERERERERES